MVEQPAESASELPAAPGPRRFGGLRDRWAATTLVSRLVGIVTVLLAVGLVLAGATSAALLEGTLVGQVDNKLAAGARHLAQSTVAAAEPRVRERMAPTDYYVRVQLDDVENLPRHLTRPRSREYGIPKVPDLTGEQAEADPGEPYTVSSTQPGSPWRVVAYPVYTATAPSPVGGRRAPARRHREHGPAHEPGPPALRARDRPARRGRRHLGRPPVARPLREIETTAAAIAAGDLSQRVPAASEHTEVGRLSAALNGMLTQIERAFAVQTASEARMRRFVADASHELRTPLATIRGYGELYRMGALTTTDQVDDTMGRIEQSATRMGALVEDLLALARMDEGRPMRGPVDLTVLAADAVSDLHALDPSRPVRLEPLRAGAAGGCEVLGEESRLRQVLANLVGNAVPHTPAGTPVEIAVGCRGRAASRCATTGPASTPSTPRACSSGSTGSTPARPRLRRRRAWAWRSSPRCRRPRRTVQPEQTPGGGTTVRVTPPPPLSPTPVRTRPPGPEGYHVGFLPSA